MLETYLDINKKLGFSWLFVQIIIHLDTRMMTLLANVEINSLKAIPAN